MTATKAISSSGIDPRIARALCLAAVALLCACETPMLGRDTVTAREPTVEVAEPLAGEALEQRKLEMRRAYRDLIHFGATVQTLRIRKDRDLREFQDYLERFRAARVDPLLTGDLASEDPEVSVLDAELRLVMAELMIEVSDYWSAGDVIDEIESRYGKRGSMLLNYPVGQQSTLKDSLEYLRKRNRGTPGQWIATAPPS